MNESLQADLLLTARLRACLSDPPPMATGDLVDIAGYRAAAVLVPIISHASAPTVLFTQRARNLAHHAGEVSFPGGAVNARDPDYVHAALRELEEEVGITRDFVTILGALDVCVTRSGFRVLPLVGIVQPGFTLTIQPSEVEAVFEVPLSHVLEERCYRLKEVDDYDRTRVFHVLEYGKNRIWGATAAILVELRQRLARERHRVSESQHVTARNCDLKRNRS